MKPLALLSFFLPALAALPAGAAVIYSGPVNLSVSFDFNGLYLNPATGSTAPNAGVEPTINLFFGGVAIGTNDLLRPVITGADQVVNLTDGTVVGSDSNYAASYNGSASHVGAALNRFQIGAPGNLGFAMQLASGGPTYYGWMQVVISNTGAGSVIDWAYDNTAGTSIAVGAVPETASLTLAMLGTTGLVLRRRR